MNKLIRNVMEYQIKFPKNHMPSIFKTCSKQFPIILSKTRNHSTEPGASNLTAIIHKLLTENCLKIHGKKLNRRPANELGWVGQPCPKTHQCLAFSTKPRVIMSHSIDFLT